MNFVKTQISGCCGQSQIIYELAAPIMREHIPDFEAAGFSIQKAFEQAGLLSAEDSILIVTGHFGSTKLNLKCKVKNCETMTASLDSVLGVLI